MPGSKDRVADCIIKQEPAIYCLQKTHFRVKDTQIQSESMEKGISPNGNDKKARVAILISDKIDFKTKAIKKDKEGHYITKGSI